MLFRLAGMPVELGSDKLRLQKLTVADFELIRRLFRDDFNARRVLHRPAVQSNRLSGKILKRLLSVHTYKISVVDPSKEIGIIGFVSNQGVFAGDMNLFICIESNHQRQGIGTRAFKSLARSLFCNTDVEAISAWENLELKKRAAPICRSWGFIPNLLATTHYFIHILERSKRRLPALGCYSISREAFLARFAEEYK